MFILENVPLTIVSTMKLGGNAAYLTEVDSRSDIAEAIAWAKERSLPFVMVGQGSNIIWEDEGYAGLVLVNKLLGYEVFEEDEENIYVTIGAGENWDSVVERTVHSEYSGIEQLSLIPGTAGATPVQNVGAYGREIADVLTTVEVYDHTQQKFVTIRASDCQFGYRSSRFKASDKGKFFISSLTIHLTRKKPEPPFYSALEKYFAEHNIKDFSPKNIRKAVIDIRSSKLPDPAKVANVGSFFHNPIVDHWVALRLVQDHEDIPHWEISTDKTKLSAAWLIEQSGFKDFHDEQTGMATWSKQPLVFVNENAKKTSDLLVFKAKIINAVEKKFGVTLEQEPELIGL